MSSSGFKLQRQAGLSGSSFYSYLRVAADATGRYRFRFRICAAALLSYLGRKESGH
jgi:hypothetical protein